jgi:hypothetical protein
MSLITVTLDTTRLSREHWDALAERANVNVFVHPTALHAVQATKFADVCVLLAFDKSAEPERLVGLLALEKKRAAPFLQPFLSAPPYNYAFLSTPVVDRAMTREVVAALLESIRKEPCLPKVVRLKYLDGDSEACAVML